MNRVTRQGQPTPIQPDFDNLKQQWATLNPIGVNSQSYAATVKTTAPACPTSGSGASAWTVDPSAQLPSLGAAALSGMTSGLPSGIPSGRITVSGVISASGTQSTSGGSQIPSESLPNLPSAGSNTGSASASGSRTATSAAGGSRSVSVPIYVDTTRTFKAFLALAAVCFGAMVFL